MQEAAWTSVPSPPSSDSDIAGGTATAEAHHAPSAMKWDRNITEKPWGEDKILSEQGGQDHHFNGLLLLFARAETEWAELKAELMDFPKNT